MPSLQLEIESLVSAAIARAFPEAADSPPLVTPATDPKFGDYQSNVAMGLKKKLAGKNPRDIAAALAAQLADSDIVEPPEIAGPGFLNLRLKPAFVAQRLAQVYADPRLGVPRAAVSRNIVVDLSGPNVAKPMHVGHIRSTIIGDCLAKLLRFLGHTVVTDNHIGDWGTQFGMLIVGYREFLDRSAYEADPIDELVWVYKIVNGLGKSAAGFFKDAQETLDKPEVDEGIKARLRPRLERLKAKVGTAAPYDARLTGDALRNAAREELVKLQQQDGENRALWREFLSTSLREFNKIYERLGVVFDNTLGESFYNFVLPGVVQDLRDKGIATVSDGAWCVFLKEPGLPDAPFIVQKSDGAFNYAATDLATLKFRAEHFKADEILYVVGAPQADHFKQLFATARKWGFDKLELRHLEFGSVLGKDGKLLRTRGSETVKLVDLLDEAEARALAIVKDKQPDLPEAHQREIARAVGVGSVKYADLQQNRSSDYKFDMDKMVSLVGNTAPYLLYAYVRPRSILREAGTSSEKLQAQAAPFVLQDPAELALAKQLLRLPDALRSVAAEHRPNLLCAYLYETADKVNRFYSDCPVRKSEGDLQRSRFQLCDLVARTLKLGLDLLGIRTIEQM